MHTVGLEYPPRKMRRFALNIAQKCLAGARTRWGAYRAPHSAELNQVGRDGNGDKGRGKKWREGRERKGWEKERKERGREWKGGRYPLLLDFLATPAGVLKHVRIDVTELKWTEYCYESVQNCELPVSSDHFSSFIRDVNAPLSVVHKPRSGARRRAL